MGVDCAITLPNNARVRDVAIVIGMAAGLPGHWEYSQGSRFWHVDGVTVKPSSIAECCIIEFDSPLDGPHHSLYHFEWDRKDGVQSRGLLPRSTAFWIGVAHRLMDFFGGSVDFNDCDDHSDLVEPEKPWIGATDGEAWDEKEERLSQVQPLTMAELREYDKHAAYSLAEMAR